MAPVNLHGDLTHAHFGRYLSVHQPAGYVRHHFPFAGSQGFEKSPQVRNGLLALAPFSITVPVGNLRSEILMVQSAQNRHHQRATDSLNSTRDRRVLVQR